MTKPTPHDRFAQAVFSNPQHAEPVFRAVLPEALARELDFTRAELLPSLFLDDDLDERRADFLFRVPLAGQEVYLLTLLEHQSSNDPTMAARLLVYAGRALDRYLRDHPRAKRLPAVIPIVLYHGARAWSAPTELLELYALSDANATALRGYVPNLRFFLDDLSQTADDELRRRPGPVIARLALVVLRHAQALRTARDPSATLDSLARSLSGLLQQARDRAGLVVILRYMLEIVELEPEEGQEILVRALPARIEEDVVTAGEILHARGRAEGKLEGKLEGMRELLLRLLRAKFPPLPAQAEQRVGAASETQLQAWSDRVLGATSLDEVFAEPA